MAARDYSMTCGDKRLRETERDSERLRVADRDYSMTLRDKRLRETAERD